MRLPDSANELPKRCSRKERISGPLWRPLLPPYSAKRPTSAQCESSICERRIHRC